MQGTVRGQPMKLKTGTSYLGALCGPVSEQEYVHIEVQ
jgi:hypothetical protein